MTEGWMTIKVQPTSHLVYYREMFSPCILLYHFQSNLFTKKFIHLLISQAVLHLENVSYMLMWKHPGNSIQWFIFCILFFVQHFCFCLQRISIILIHTYINMLLFYGDIFVIYFRKLYGRFCIHMCKCSTNLVCPCLLYVHFSTSRHMRDKNWCFFMISARIWFYS